MDVQACMPCQGKHVPGTAYWSNPIVLIGAMHQDSYYQKAHHAIDCSQTIGVECDSLDGPDLRCHGLLQRWIKHMHLASGLFDDVLLKGRLPIRPASISSCLPDNVRHAEPEDIRRQPLSFRTICLPRDCVVALRRLRELPCTRPQVISSGVKVESPPEGADHATWENQFACAAAGPIWHVSLLAGRTPPSDQESEKSQSRRTQRSRSHIRVAATACARRKATCRCPLGWGLCQSSPSRGNCRLAGSSPRLRTHSSCSPSSRVCQSS